MSEEKDDHSKKTDKKEWLNKRRKEDKVLIEDIETFIRKLKKVIDPKKDH